MGKLRKIGRKVSRALGKVFGKKLGNLIGGIGLSMIMWGGAKVLFPGLTSTISQQMTNFKTKVFGTPAEAVVDVADTLEKVPNIESKVSDTLVKDAVVKDTVAGDLVTQNMSPIETTSLLEGTTSNVANMNPVSNPLTEQLASAPAGSGELTLGETFMSGVNKIGEGIKNLPSNTAEFIADIPNKIAEAPGKAYDYVTEGEFVGDVFEGAAVGGLTASIMGDPEEPFVSGGVAMQPIQEAAQANYIREVSPSAMAATGMTRPLSFQELSQQTLYGTGSPSWMADFYQPLPTPKAIG
jgi:hypothetical protein